MVVKGKVVIIMYEERKVGIKTWRMFAPCCVGTWFGLFDGVKVQI